MASSTDTAGEAKIGCPAFVPGKGIAASSDGVPTPLLDRLPSRPMAAAVVDELRW